MKKPTTRPIQPWTRKQNTAGRDGRDEDQFVEPDQFRELGEVLDDVRVVFLVFVGKHPADVRPVKALELGGMQVLVGVGMLVMMAVMGRPPERALLRRAAAEEGEEELERAAGLVAAMGKITVKRAGDAELADEEHERAEAGGLHVDPGPDHREAHEVHDNEHDARKGDTETTVHIRRVEYRSNRPRHNLYPILSGQESDPIQD